MAQQWIQKIYFGPPGCGKSYQIRDVAKNELKIGDNNSRMIETTFHPEYGYGDFVAKLLPRTVHKSVTYALESSEPSLAGTKVTQTAGGNSIEYHIHAGPLVKAIARAYSRLDKDEDENVLLVIDEINRGNCAQIFGDIFQLLDRNGEGWSQYGVDMSDLTREALQQEMGKSELPNELKVDDENGKTIGYKLRLPPNLSIIGTMNTSDESVYYMDTAFKRRWDFEYMPWYGYDGTPESQKNANIRETDYSWSQFLEKLNDFIAAKFSGRNVDDKLVGIWFLRTNNFLETLDGLKGKLLATDWQKFFPNAKNYDKGANLGTLSVKQDIEAYGAVWPSDKINATKPEELAEALYDANKNHISRKTLRNKLMFYLWDNVFTRDRESLADLLVLGGSLHKEPPRTFGDFSTDENVTFFIEGVMKFGASTETTADQ